MKLKALYITVVVLLLACGTASGQRAKLLLGFNAGLNNTGLVRKADTLQISGRGGFQLGLLFRLGYKKHYGQLDIAFVRGATEYNITKNLNRNGTIPDIGYYAVSFPLVYGFYVIKYPVYKHRVFGGITTTVVGKVRGENTFGFGKDMYQNPGWSMTLGSGMDIAFFTLDFKYDLGLRKIYKEVARTQSHEISLILGFVF